METQNQILALASVCKSFPLLSRLLEKRGQFVGALWVRNLKTRKGINSIVTKETRATVRAGLDHESRAKVQDARESGELPSENQGLPWGNWFAFPFVIEHKGNFYARLYPVENRIPRVIYRENGVRISRERAEELCLASEFSSVRGDIGCMTLGLANLRRVR